MLLHAVKIIVRELNAHFENVLTDPLTTNPPVGEDQVELGNIMLMERNGGVIRPDLQNNIGLTVVNLRKEKTLKNSPYSRINEAHLRTEYFKPPIILNVFLLFSATSGTYDKVLSVLPLIGPAQRIICFRPLLESINYIVFTTHTSWSGKTGQLVLSRKRIRPSVTEVFTKICPLITVSLLVPCQQ